MNYNKQLMRHTRKLEKKVRKLEKQVKGGGNSMQQYNKAIVALVVGGLVLILRHFNFPIDTGFQDALGVVVTAALVWLVPNKA